MGHTTDLCADGRRLDAEVGVPAEALEVCVPGISRQRVCFSFSSSLRTPSGCRGRIRPCKQGVCLTDILQNLQIKLQRRAQACVKLKRGAVLVEAGRQVLEIEVPAVTECRLVGVVPDLEAGVGDLLQEPVSMGFLRLSHGNAG
jgi:hypothetical protein